MVNGVNGNFNTQYQAYLSQPMNVDQLGGQNTAPINFTAQQKLAEENRVDNVKDGKDDGHIGFWRATGHLLKGATLNVIGGILGFDPDGNWHFGQFLTNAAIIAGSVALIIATSGAATPFLATAGVALAGTSLANGIYDVATAETDAECEAAFEQVGTGITTTALAIFGAKSAQKGVVANKLASGEITSEEAAALNKSYSGTKGLFKATGDLYKGVGKDIAAYGKNTYTQITTQAGEGANISTKLGATKDVLSEQYKNFKTTARENYHKTVYTGEDAELEARAIQDKINAAEKTVEKYATKAKKARFNRLAEAYDAKADRAYAKWEKLVDLKANKGYTTPSGKVGYSGLRNDVTKYANAGWADVPTRWVTVNAAAEKFQTSAEAKMMSMLTPEEKRYVASLPKEQREQMVKQFEKYAA